MAKKSDMKGMSAEAALNRIFNIARGMVSTDYVKAEGKGRKALQDIERQQKKAGGGRAMKKKKKMMAKGGAAGGMKNQPK